MKTVFSKSMCAIAIMLAIALMASSCNSEAVKNTTEKNDSEKTTVTVTEEQMSMLAKKIDALELRVSEQHLTFTVGMTPVSGYEIASITGEREITESENTSIQNNLKALDTKKKDAERSSDYLTINGKKLSPQMTKLDLREYGLVTPVKDQGTAGSCWAFGSMAAYESTYDVMNSKEINSSEQYVINCSGAGTAKDGGLAFEVFMWMVTNTKNVDDEVNNPYRAIDEACKPLVPNTDYFAIEWNLIDPARNPSAKPTVKQIKEAICKYGVISASVFVSDLFQNYTGGIFKENEIYTGTNHAIALIGWDDSKNAWILRNSWGPGWGESCGFAGEKGYMWIDYNANNVGRRGAWVKAKKNIPR